MEIENARDAIKRLDDDERTLVSIYGASNGIPVSAVTEFGLYSRIRGKGAGAIVLTEIKKRGMAMSSQVSKSECSWRPRCTSPTPAAKHCRPPVSKGGSLLRHPIIVDIARRHDGTPAQVCLS